ncbi:MAG: hypothetical protein M3370_05070 [Actinomycetota bacterium]|nr:hypothetical protein [Actinomycetota bacterium]
MSRRDQIRMTDAEVGVLLEEERTLVWATIGRDGWPHLMPLWYGVADLGAEILARYGRGGEPTDELRAAVAAQAAKRVGLEFGETERATWDHRKLGAGTY